MQDGHVGAKRAHSRTELTLEGILGHTYVMFPYKTNRAEAKTASALFAALRLFESGGFWHNFDGVQPQRHWTIVFNMYLHVGPKAAACGGNPLLLHLT